MPGSNAGDDSHHQPLSSGAILVVATCFAHGANFIFQMIMGRLLGQHPGEFGVMNTMLNIFSMFAIPATALQLAIARQTAIYADRGELDSIAALLRRASRKAGLAAVVVLVAMLALSPWLRNYLQLATAGPIYVTAVMVGIGIVIPVAAGALQGLKRFGWMSATSIAAPLIRIAAGVALVWAGWKASGALCGTFAGNVAMLVLSGFALAAVLRRKVAAQTLDTAGVYRYLLPTLISLACYAGLVNLDLIIVKHYFKPEEASQYAAASLFGRAVGWLISPLCTVLFPHVWDENRHEANRALLLKFLLAAAGLGIAAACVCTVTSGLLTKLLLGRADAEVTALIPLCAWAMLPIGVANVFLNFVMARGRYGFLVSFVTTAVLYLVGFALWHDTLRHVVAIVAVFGVATLALFVAITYGKSAKSKVV
jgi:O-antigen/teichoic acid export membrane protein